MTNNLFRSKNPRDKALMKAVGSRRKKSYSGHYQTNAAGAVRQLSQKTAEKKGLSQRTNIK
jgi:hypothetical protein